MMLFTIVAIQKVFHNLVAEVWNTMEQKKQMQMEQM